MAASEEGGGALKFVGGRPCLDFINTVGGWNPDRGSARAYKHDKLGGYSDLVKWGRLGGVLTGREADALHRQADRRPGRAREIFARGMALRLALYRVLTTTIDGGAPAPANLEVVAREVTDARRHERLAAGGGAFAWRLDDRMALDRVLWLVARSAAELLTSPELARVRRCDGDECGWLFLDATRNGSRRWCDMGDCGNVAKARRFRRRHGSTG